MHYAKYAVLYLRRVFFFDSNPPLGKMLVAAAARAAGYDGGDVSGAASTDAATSDSGLTYFDRIGTPYPEALPVFAMRLVPALSGSAIAPLVYLIAVELGLSPWAATCAGTLVILGNEA